MNTTGKIKAGIITLGALINLIVTAAIPHYQPHTQAQNFFFAVVCLVFGLFVIPIIIKFNSLIWLKQIIEPNGVIIRLGFAIRWY